MPKNADTRAPFDAVTLLLRLAAACPDRFAVGEDAFWDNGKVWLPLRNHALPDQDLGPLLAALKAEVEARGYRRGHLVRWDWGVRSMRHEPDEARYLAMVWIERVGRGGMDGETFEASGPHEALALAAALVEALEQGRGE